MTRKKRRETHLWQIDPSLYEPPPKAGLLERYIHSPARSLTKHTLYALAFAYPLLLVTLGIAFGGIVFWGSLTGSFLVIWLIIKKAGYAENFATWNMGYKPFLGLVGAFAIYASLIYGLEYIKLWTIPIFGTILVIALILGIWIINKR